MKRLYALFALLLALAAASAQNDPKARVLLDKAAEQYRQPGSIRITFGGTRQGTLLLQGECFFLDCAGVKSWFDGKTQWSYVEQNKEVTISSPTPEELQRINPYALVTLYPKTFGYRYAGTAACNGKKGDKIVLTPHEAGEISSITLLVSADSHPISISIHPTEGEDQVFTVSSYVRQPAQPDATFRFDPGKYPGTETIDMRE